MRVPAYALFILLLAGPAWGQTTRFCLEGEMDLGARYQGMKPADGEFYPTTWCVVTEAGSERVQFSGSGRSNPDMDGDWTVAYFPPGLVRIINRDDPPDIEFHDTDNAGEARSVRRLDPHRLLSEFFEHPERLENLELQHDGNRVVRVNTSADLPLRGRVDVVWRWDWSDPDSPKAELEVDDAIMFTATGRWEDLDETEAAKTWTATPGANPVEVPGEFWPARVAMERVELAPGVHLVKGVRTGFQHMVVETSEGLVIGDAPAGWVEFHQIPPADLVPGLGVSGLSEQLVDFLRLEFPDQRIAAAVITHAHDDHAGGARAFAAAGALVYAPAGIEAFLEISLNRANMPDDRLSQAQSSIDIVPVLDPVTIGQGGRQVRLLPLGKGPHVDAILGLWAVEQGYFFVSDVHVPHSDADTPREERAVTECWFAGKAVAALPESTLVLNSHSGVETPVSRLKRYLDSEACKQVLAGS